MPRPSAIPRQSLTEAVAEKLREKIIHGDLREGEQLRQDVIAEEFQVSRIPVREALRQLMAEGLIEIYPNRGAVVSALAPSEIEELFQIRALLEGELLRRSIPNLTAPDFDRAEAVLRRFERELQNADHVRHWGKLNAEFHVALYAGAELPQFKALIRTVNNNGDRFVRLQLYLTHRIERANREHEELLALARAREVDSACRLLEEHIREAGRSLRAAVEEKQEEGKHQGA